MPIQFLDTRISLSLLDDEETITLEDTPILLGDIGLQTAAVVGTPNQSLIRVELAGTIGVSRGSRDSKHSKDSRKSDHSRKSNGSDRSGSSVTINIQRGGTEELGSGTIIYTAIHDLTGTSGTQLVSFDTGDFPSAQDAASGQIRYTMFISRNGNSRITVTGPASFTGNAAAGND